MNIEQARTDRHRLMNISDMLEIAGEHLDQETVMGEPERVIRVSSAYYGGFNTASDTRNFKRVRGQ